MGAIGTGSQGKSNMRDFLKLNKEVQFVAVCDVDSNNLLKAKQIADSTNDNKDCRVYGDYREILEKEKLDAVCIALPDHWHGIIYSAAAEKKVHVYGEKPICRTIKDGQTIVSAVEKNDIIWQTGSWQRSQPNFHRGAELAINGRAGTLKYIEVGLPYGSRGIGTPPPKDVPHELHWEMWLGPAPKVAYRGVSHWDWHWILGGDMGTFNPDFSKYNLVVVDYNGDSWNEKTKTAFVDFVNKGGGVDLQKIWKSLPLLIPTQLVAERCRMGRIRYEAKTPQDYQKFP